MLPRRLEVQKDNKSGPFSRYFGSFKIPLCYMIFIWINRDVFDAMAYVSSRSMYKLTG